MIGRRQFLAVAAGLLLWPSLRPKTAGADTSVPPESLPPTSLPPTSLPEGAARALATSPTVYISPLRSDGSESSCHGEVWFGWIDGAVVVNTSPDRWKATSLRRGLDRARIWVGDYGRWKGSLGTSEDFRAGSVFDARAKFIDDPAVLDRLLAIYETKYPAEIGKWRDKMRDGIRDGSRVLIGYRPA